MFNNLLGGWVRDDNEVERLMAQMPMPLFQSTPPPEYGKNAFLYEIVRKIRGEDNLGVQKIGDCVSWGFARLVDYLQAVEVHLDTENNANPDADYGYEDTATEPIYALSRVEVGRGRLGNSDGSVGAWAADAIKQYGTLSYKELARQGQKRYLRWS